MAPWALSVQPPWLARPGVQQFGRRPAKQQDQDPNRLAVHCAIDHGGVTLVKVVFADRQAGEPLDLVIVGHPTPCSNFEAHVRPFP